MTLHRRIADMPGRAHGGRLRRTEFGRGTIGGWVYEPANVDATQPPLVAVHGISRDEKEQIDLFAAAAQRTNRVVIAPHFPENVWKSYQRITRRRRADRALLAYLDMLREQGIADARRFDLFGYSGGAQFAHRFAMLYPQRIRRLSVAAAGWYCMPNRDAPYPYGLGSAKGPGDLWADRLKHMLDGFLRLPVTVLVGACDVQADAAFRRSHHLDRAQGTTRVARAERYHRALQQAASQKGIAGNFHFVRLPGCAHSFSQCVLEGGLAQHVLG